LKQQAIIEILLKGAKKAQSGLQSLGSKIKGLTKNLLSNKLSWVAVSAAIVAAIRTFTQLESKIIDVGNLFGATAAEMDAMQSSVVELSTKGSQSASDLASALFDVISAGVDASESLSFLETSSKLATAGVTTTKVAVDGLTSVINAYGLEASDAAMISDKFFAAQVEGKTTIAELANGVGRVAPMANAAGVSIDEMFGSLVALTKVGIRTDEAVVGVRQTLASIITPTKEASEYADRLGINFSAAALKSNGLIGVMEEIKQKTGGNIEAMAKLFPNIRALSAAVNLAGGSMDDFKEGTDKVKTSLDVVNEAAKKQEKSLGGSFKRLGSTFQQTGNVIVQALEPILKALNAVVIFMLSHFNKAVRGMIADAKGLFSSLKNIGNGTVNFFKKIKIAITKTGEERTAAFKELNDKELEDAKKHQEEMDAISQYRMASWGTETAVKQEQTELQKMMAAAKTQAEIDGIIKEYNAKEEAKKAEKKILEDAKKEAITLAQEGSDALGQVAEDGGKASIEFLKKQLNAKVDAWVAAEVGQLGASAFTTFGASLLAIAPAMAAGAAAKAAINAVGFDKGGEYEINQPMAVQSASGQTVTMAENRSESVKVDNDNSSTSESGGGSLNVTINLDGKTVAKQLYPHIKAIQRGII